jgi:hypothetical protein
MRGMKMLMGKKGSIIFGIIIIILGILIIPTVSTLIFKSNICGHPNMYLVGFAVILLGIFIVLKEIKY